MPRIVARLLAPLLAFAVFASVVPSTVIAQDATPEASSQTGPSTAAPAVGASIVDMQTACDPAHYPAGASGITYQPLEDYGFVIPADIDDHNLYLTVDTLTPGSCLLFDRGAHGASTYHVLAGTVEFIAWRAWDPAEPVMMAGNANGVSAPLPSGAPVTLNAGDWVTVDRDLEAYAYRNPGTGESQIVMAVIEKLGPRNGCASGCRRHP